MRPWMPQLAGKVRVSGVRLLAAVRRPRLSRRQVVTSALSAVALAGTVVVVAVAYVQDGYPVERVSLNDGGVWVTSRTEGALGRFNKPIEQLDSMLMPSAGNQPDLDVLQEGPVVFAYDRGAADLRRVDVAAVEVAPDTVKLPPAADVAMGGGTVAVLDPATGRLWTRSADTVSTLDTKTEPPTAEVGGDAAVTVGLDGVAHAVSAVTHRLVTVIDAAGRTPRVTQGGIPAAFIAPVHVAAVGAEPVVVDGTGRVALPDGGQASLPMVKAPTEVALQQSGPASGTALIATGTGLYGVGLDDHDVTTLTAGSGGAVAPVRLGRCAYAAWSARPRYARLCDGTAAEARELGGLAANAALRLRVNRDNIVLNELAVGAVFVFDRGGVDLGNWAAVRPVARLPKQDKLDREPDKRKTARNREPLARPDRLRARTGRSATLAVLDNDGDPDGDILVVSTPGAVPPDVGRVHVVHNGQAIQFTANQTWRRPVTFAYTIDDGRGGTATSSVTLTPQPDTVNTAPRRLRTETLMVGLGGEATMDVLRDWRDDDGDQLVLASASGDAPDTGARATPEGDLTFTDGGRSSGRKAAHIAVGDGRGAPVTADVPVEVLPEDRDAPPKANDDLVRAMTGTPTVLRPLANDTDPQASAERGSRLRLTRLIGAAPSGSTAVLDHVAGTIRFTGSRSQTYYLTYEVTNGSHVARAAIRVDVQGRAVNTAPVAVADRASVHGTAGIDVDVLANDVDDDGDVLAVATVAVASNSGLAVSVRDHRWLHIDPTEPGEGAVGIRYTVSDGSNTTTGDVEVTRLPASDGNEPPTPHDDVVTVRAGNVVEVDVLANDADPEALPLQLQPEVVPDDARVRWLAAARTVRVQAPERAGTISATYTVRDAGGRSANARITATVVAADPEHNQPPRPAPIQARAFAGTTTRIAVPTAGADPDGDSVSLVGAAEAPRYGRIVAAGPDYLDYEAYPAAAGTDEFTYQMRDSLGARGSGTVRVGVVPRPEQSAPPLAVDDTYTVAPGATVRVPVLGNDSDPDADPLRLEPLLRAPAGARLDRDRVVVTAGGNDGDVVTLQYGVGDGRGQRSAAAVTITARKGANLPPIARDDLVTTLTPGQTVATVDVRANDDDLDGPRGDLTVKALGDGTDLPVTVTPDGKLRITVATTTREVAYQVTDSGGATAVAFVRVAAGGDQLPHRRADAPALALTSGGRLVVELDTQVVDPEAQTVRLTSASGVETSPVPGLSVVPGSIKADRLTIAALGTFDGPAGLAVEVTDRAGDVPARTRVIMLPVTVQSTAAAPLVLACPPAEPQVGAPAIVVDVAACVTGVTEDERGRLRFGDLSGAPKGVTATLTEDGRLSVAAGPTADPTEPVPLKVGVTGERGRSGAGTVRLNVKPAGRAVANTDVVSGVRSGQRLRIDVVANDRNPFPDAPLTVVDVRSATAGVSASVDGDRRHVAVTVGESFHGAAVLTYRVQDQSGQAERIATGEVEISVAGRPAAPVKPVVQSSGNASVVLQWREPADNGETITGYDVTGAGFRQHCSTTVCALTGLDNGATYQFRVTATNAAGTGPASPPSDVVTPDVKPDQPVPPTTTFGDTAVTVTWAPPQSEGSAVKRYEVQISPAVGAGVRTSTGRSLVWPGLTNGTGYAFQVRAFNASGQASDWSALSAPEIPAREPEAPVAPTAEGVTDGIGEQMVVNWSAPADNGAPITAYRLAVLRSGAVDRTLTIDGDTVSTTVGVVNGENYTFRVAATNKAGTSVNGPASSPAVAHGKPARISAVSVSDNDAGRGLDRRLRYEATPPDDNGMAITRYELSYDGGDGVNATSGSSGGFLDGLSNGTGYRVKARACNDMCGDWSEPSATATPYGPVGAPGAGANRDGSRAVRVSWSAPGANGRPISRVEIRVDGGGWDNVGTGNGDRVVGNGPDQRHSIEVRAFDSAGQVSATSGADATTAAPEVIVSKGAPRANSASCTGCNFINVQLRNFPSGASVTCTFDSQHGSGGFVRYSRTVDGAGNHGTESSTNYYGYRGEWVSATCNGVRGQVTW
jgi:hypothetical protein